MSPLSTIFPARMTTVLRDRPDDAEVVRDEQVGQAGLGLDVGEQLEHLRLHGHVEGAGRLVADEQLGLGREGPGDADALALTAGELRRLAVQGRRAGRPGRSARPPCRVAPLGLLPAHPIGSATISWAVRCGSSEP